MTTVLVGRPVERFDWFRWCGSARHHFEAFLRRHSDDLIVGDGGALFWIQGKEPRS